MLKNETQCNECGETLTPIMENVGHSDNQVLEIEYICNNCQATPDWVKQWTIDLQNNTNRKV